MFFLSVPTARGSVLPVLFFQKDSPSSSSILNTPSTFLPLRTFLKPDGQGKVSNHRWQSPSDFCEDHLYLCACLLCVCTCVQLCVCMLRPKGSQSRWMYKHVRPAGVNKELITFFSSTSGLEKKQQRNPVISHIFYLRSLPCMVIYENNVNVPTGEAHTYLCFVFISEMNCVSILSCQLVSLGNLPSHQ